MKRVLAIIICFFVWGLFAWLGWNIIAYNFNLPQFGYWQIFLILLGLRSTVAFLINHVIEE